MMALRLIRGRSIMPAVAAVSRRMLSDTAGGAAAAGGADDYKYETLLVSEPKENVFLVKINRPEKLNAMNRVFWREIGHCFDRLNDDNNCRVVVLGGEGRLFTAGIDLADLASIGAAAESQEEDVARRGRLIHRSIREFQSSFSALERCVKPVIASIHGACVGGGVDLVCGADIRYCTSDAWFQVKEVEVGLAADVGTLQRLPKVVGGQSLARELVFTARKMYSKEALNCGFVSRVFDDKESLEQSAIDTAYRVACKSPVAVQTSKMALIYSRDHSVEDGLDYVAKLNMLMLQSEDVKIAAMSLMSKGQSEAKYSKL